MVLALILEFFIGNIKGYVDSSTMSYTFQDTVTKLKFNPF